MTSAFAVAVRERL